MTLYLDENVAPVIADLVRRHGIDATSAQDVGNVQLNDRAQLAYATQEGRAIVTADLVDFVQLARDAVATNTEHAGIILLPSSSWGDEFQAIADAIVKGLKPYGGGLRGVVLYIRRG